MKLWVGCYWRFKGAESYRYGWSSMVPNGLIRMGRWNGDTTGGTVVDPKDIETKPYR